MKNFKYVILAIAMALPGFAVAQDKGVKLTGFVYDIETQKPLSGVNVQVENARAGTVTSSEGYFEIKVAKVPARLRFSYMGYEPNQYMAGKADGHPVKIYLKQAVNQIGEVTIPGQRIMNLIRGDTLNIVDYELAGDYIIMAANPYKHAANLRLYLTTLEGDIIASRRITGAGHDVEVPESISIKTRLYLFRDCYHNIQLLTRDKVYQIFVNRNNLNLLYPTPFEQFMTLLFPAKACLNNRLFFQKSTLVRNETYYIDETDKKYVLIKTVTDESGPYRYAKPIHFLEERTDPGRIIMKGSWEKCVCAPVVERDNDIAIFDFFGNNIEFFNSDGVSVKSVPISFHLRETREFLANGEREIDQDNFTQKIMYDDKTGRFWSVWRYKSNRRYALKEINPDTGQVIKVVEVPDYPSIDKLQINNNILYFLYSEMVYPFGRSLYRMVI